MVRDTAVLLANGQVLRRNWLLPASAIGFALVILMATNEFTAPFGYFAVFMAAVFSLFSISRNASPRARPVSIRAEVGHVSIGGVGVPANRIQEAKIVARKADAVVANLTMRDGRPWLLRMRPEDGDALVQVLGAAPGERRSTFPLLPAHRTRLLIAASPFAAVCAAWLVHLIVTRQIDYRLLLVFAVADALMIGMAAVPIALLAGLFRGKIVVGADGFAVKFFRERFYPYADVRAVRAITPLRDHFTIDTVVELAGGKRVRLRTPQAQVRVADRGAEARALHAHLAKAFERARARIGETRNLAPLLARGQASDKEWLARIDSLVRGGAARYRVAAPDSDVLTEIASNATSSLDVRVGACAALVRMGEEGRRAVRVAADTCADPKVRVALVELGAADSDEGVIESLSRA